MKAPVFFYLAHMRFLLLLLFRFPPYRSPSFIERYSRQQVKFAFCPTWAGKAPSGRLRCDGLGLPPERYSIRYM